MGAWDSSCFANDDAQDWSNRLIDSHDGMKRVGAALECVADAGDEFIDAPRASEALAAAEVVAALSGTPAGDMPTDLASWLSGRPLADDALRALAQRAVRRVGTDSELRALWDEAGSLGEWLSVLSDLDDRLA